MNLKKMFERLSELNSAVRHAEEKISELESAINDIRFEFDKLFLDEIDLDDKEKSDT